MGFLKILTDQGFGFKLLSREVFSIRSTSFVYMLRGPDIYILYRNILIRNSSLNRGGARYRVTISVLTACAFAQMLRRSLNSGLPAALIPAQRQRLKFQQFVVQNPRSILEVVDKKNLHL